MLAGAGLDTETLIDGEPDILADMPGVFSVARFRYAHGARYELTVTEHAEPEDREVAFWMLPPVRTFLCATRTNMHGTEHEVTLSFWTAL